MNSKQLAIFDFDGTISYKDSFIDFMRFTHGRTRTYVNYLWLSPAVILYGLKIWPNWKVKPQFLKAFYQGWTEPELRAKASIYARELLPLLIRPKAMQKIKWHKDQGHLVVIVSASFEEYLNEWCYPKKLDCIATKIEFNNGKVTGRFATPNCHGQEKVRRIKEKYDLKLFQKIYAYGDTKGDLALKAIADEFYYRPFE